MNKKNITNVTTTMLLLLFMCFSIIGCDDDNKDIVVPDNWVTVPSEPLSISYKGGDLSCDYTLAPGLNPSVVYVISMNYGLPDILIMTRRKDTMF